MKKTTLPHRQAHGRTWCMPAAPQRSEMLFTAGFLLLLIAAAMVCFTCSARAAAPQEAAVLATDNESVPDVPAPWLLTGSGYIVVVNLSKEFILQNGFVPEELKDSYVGGPSMIMVVDYKASNAGPYRELLFIPGRFDIEGKQRWSITKIYVSTWKSVKNGRQNWGIPKEMADFTFTSDTPGLERIQVSAGGQQIADMTFSNRGPMLPVLAGPLLAGFLRFGQFYDNSLFLFSPSAAGLMGLTKMQDKTFNSFLFPDIAQGTVLLALRTPLFLIKFPVSRVMPMP